MWLWLYSKIYYRVIFRRWQPNNFKNVQKPEWLHKCMWLLIIFVFIILRYFIEKDIRPPHYNFPLTKEDIFWPKAHCLTRSVFHIYSNWYNCTLYFDDSSKFIYQSIPILQNLYTNRFFFTRWLYISTKFFVTPNASPK